MSGVLRKKGFLIFLAVVLAAAMLIWIPMVGKYSLEDPLPVSADPALISEDPKPFLGRRVQVEGEVQRIFGPRAFAIDKPDTDGPLLLVVGRKPWSLLQRNPQVNDLLRNDHVQVMGRVRRFSLKEFQKEGGTRGYDSLLRAWEGKPVLLALDLELTPGVPDYFPGSAGGKGLGGRGEPDSTDPADLPDSLHSLQDAEAESAFGRP